MAKHGERKIACLAADARHYEIRFIECLAGMDCRPAPVRVNDELEFPRPQHRKRDAHARSGFLETQDFPCFSLAFGHVTVKEYPATHGHPWFVVWQRLMALKIGRAACRERVCQYV